MNATYKARFAYGGRSIQDGSMDIRELAPALMAFSDLVEGVYAIIGGEQKVRILLNQDSIQQGAFDLTLFLDNVSILDHVKIFMTGAEKSGLKDLMDILGWGSAVSPGIFWLIQKIRNRKIVSVDRNKTKITLQDGEEITASAKAIDVFMDVKCRVSIEKVLAPLEKCEGIDSFELRNPDKPEDKKPILKIKSDEVHYFKAPPPEDVSENISQETVEQEIFASIETINFNDGKWKLNDGTNRFWVTLQDEDFSQRIENGEIAFRKGDMLKIRYYMKQIIKGGKLTTEYFVTRIIEHHQKAKQIKLDFE